MNLGLAFGQAASAPILMSFIYLASIPKNPMKRKNKFWPVIKEICLD